MHDPDDLTRRTQEAVEGAEDNHALGRDGDEPSHADEESGLAPDSDTVATPDGAVQEPPD